MSPKWLVIGMVDHLVCHTTSLFSDEIGAV